MSELTRCNFCTLKLVRANAKKRGAKVQVRAGQGEWEGWTLVMQSDQPKPTHYFRALGDHCEC